MKQVRVVIPARNEERLLPQALRAVRQAVEHTRHLAAMALDVRVTVVADRCADRTEAVAKHLADEVIILEAGSVGAARAAGCAVLLSSAGSELRDDAVMLCTDADSLVPPTWITEHLAHIDAGAHIVAGTVRVHDWSDRPASLKPRYERTYSASAAHVHGANLSFTAAAYRAVGGFKALATGEDQDLVDRMLAAGMRVEFCTQAAVMTSGRSETRAKQGFGDYLTTLEAAS
ncbi:glycosyltransferase [Nesterenkonia haasae]|uniref:glycosyltransferase n=1 Tax=Nesterenkonia haasae TaxID=2587813 RepID=UPI0013914095|nr:glycosyltransferase [Nesterenkonia haasae]NDK33216.1 glycosyltransferase [Nesterenkonia haasae]